MSEYDKFEPNRLYTPKMLVSMTCVNPKYKSSNGRPIYRALNLGVVPYYKLGFGKRFMKVIKGSDMFQLFSWLDKNYNQRENRKPNGLHCIGIDTSRGREPRYCKKPLVARQKQFCSTKCRINYQYYKKMRKLPLKTQ